MIYSAASTMPWAIVCSTVVALLFEPGIGKTKLMGQADCTIITLGNILNQGYFQ